MAPQLYETLRLVRGIVRFQVSRQNRFGINHDMSSAWKPDNHVWS